MEEIIDVFIASDRSYYSGLYVALLSCVKNTQANLRFTLILNEKDKRSDLCLNHIRDADNVVEVRVLKIKDLQGINNYKGRSHFSKMAFARLRMGEIYEGTNVKNVLYLDPDIIIENDLNDLWQLRGKKPLAMSVELNSGVMLMDLDYWHSEGMDDKCVEVWREHGASFKHPDQDLLISIFCDNDLCDYFPFEEWNLGSGFWDGKSKALIHCIGGRKPWHEDYSYPLVKALFENYYESLFGKNSLSRGMPLINSLGRRVNNLKIKLGIK